MDVVVVALLLYAYSLPKVQYVKIRKVILEEGGNKNCLMLDDIIDCGSITSISVVL